MATHVAIVKTVGDLSKRPRAHKRSHAAYPLVVKEYNSHEEALAAHPTSQIMDIEQYRAHKAKMNAMHGVIKEPRPWWKFWGK